MRLPTLGDLVTVNGRQMRVMRVTVQPPSEDDTTAWPDIDPERDVIELELQPVGDALREPTP